MTTFNVSYQGEATKGSLFRMYYNTKGVIFKVKDYIKWKYKTFNYE